ncbi:hypothetical protein [Ferrovibrio sp.]|uniref:hypothetical protein n=1 Tax=Ferrovibrio sp. TaxID=1917215 RepID=UPI00262444C9|nr:hypothetical protein [Ferrovibrio sp.]
MKHKSKVVALQPASPAKAAVALPPPLVAAMFGEAGVALRAGRPETISATLGPAVTRFRALARKLPFEREPGLFPVPVAELLKNRKKKKARA